MPDSSSNAISEEVVKILDRITKTQKTAEQKEKEILKLGAAAIQQVKEQVIIKAMKEIQTILADVDHVSKMIEKCTAEAKTSKDAKKMLKTYLEVRKALIGDYVKAIANLSKAIDAASPKLDTGGKGGSPLVDLQGALKRMPKLLKDIGKDNLKAQKKLDASAK